MTHKPEEQPRDYHVLVSVGKPDQLDTLLFPAQAIARSRQGRVTLLVVTPSGERPDWLSIPQPEEGPPVNVIVRSSRDIGKAILDCARELSPDLLLLNWRGSSAGKVRYLQGRTLDNVVLRAPCNVAVVHGAPPAQIKRILIPAAGGPNATLAMQLALQMAPDADITALYVAKPSRGESEALVGTERLREILQPWAENPRIHPKVIESPGIVRGILSEASTGYDLTLVGASKESFVDRFLFGNVPQTIALRNEGTTLIVRQQIHTLHSLLPSALWIINDLFPSLTLREKAAVIRDVRNSARPSTNFFVMLSLSAAIAALGLLMNSAAVIIGAMLIAPLMSAVIGMAMGIAEGDSRLLWVAANTAFRSILAAIAIGLLIAVLVPNHQPTQEILARTQPTLLDLVVALASGAAGAYAICRRDMSGALPGVAIAVALIPPLTTAGIGLRLGNAHIAGGALLLFATNVVAIIAAGGLVMLLLGFYPPQTREGGTKTFRRGMATTLLLLIAVSVPLAALTIQSIRNVALHRQIENALETEVLALGQSELADWQLSNTQDSTTLHLEVWVRSVRPIRYGETVALEKKVATRLQRPVALVLSVIPITKLDPFVPPTFTPTPTFTATPSPTPTYTATPTDTPTSTPSATPTATATNTPTTTPTPSFTPTVITGTEGVTTTLPLTGTEGVTTTLPLTGTEGVTTTLPLTGTEGVTTTLPLTGTEEVTTTLPLTGTVRISTPSPTLQATPSALQTAEAIPPTSREGTGTTTPLLISALYYDTYLSYEPEEAFQLTNISTGSVDLAGWQVGDEGKNRVTFPALTLPAGHRLWCTRTATAFSSQFGFPPGCEYDGESDANVPNLSGKAPTFSNNGDAIRLFDNQGNLRDALVYEEGQVPATGWTGPPVQPNDHFPAEGQILYRKLDPATGLPAIDTDTLSDWAQDPADPYDGRKVRYPAWRLEDFYRPVSVTSTTYLTVAVAPDAAYPAIASLLRSARRRIEIETYTFENVDLAGIITGQLASGVTVTLLLDGSPVGGISDEERWICKQIAAAGGEVLFLRGDSAAHIHKRYAYQHAKFIVVDAQTLAVGSENLGYTSLPADDKSNGTWGSRGVYLLTGAPALVARAQRIMVADRDTVHADVIPWGTSPFVGPPPGFLPAPGPEGWSYPAPFSVPLTISGTLAWEMVHSPENSLSRRDGLIRLLDAATAGDVVLIEQLNERAYWGAPESDPIQDPNPRLEAAIDAARRGATVRILLDRYYDDSADPRSNRATRDYVNRLAASEGLDLQARVGNPTGRGIHNKMVILQLDGKAFIHVGSINGSENSNKNNRELALQVQSNAAGDYLASVFDYDWQRGIAQEIYLPLVTRR